MQRKKLEITKCIIIGDARRLEKGLTALRTMWGLSKALEDHNVNRYDARTINQTLRNADTVGIKRFDRNLTGDLCHLLQVDLQELFGDEKGTVNS